MIVLDIKYPLNLSIYENLGDINVSRQFREACLCEELFSTNAWQ